MPEPYPVKDVATIRNDWLRVYANGLRLSGIARPNITPNSEAYAEATAIANEIAVGMAFVQSTGDEVMPDTASAPRLLRYGRIHGLELRPPAGAAGFILLRALAPSVTVPLLARLIDDAGLVFEVLRGGIYLGGAPIPVRALDTGSATNHAPGDLLRWTAVPAYAELEAEVAQSGLTGGREQEDIETFRERVLARFREPPGNDNAQAIAELAEKASPKVQKAFVYPALRGPSTFGVSVIGYADRATRAREIDEPTLRGEVEPYLLARLPEHAALDLTTVVSVGVDVAVRLTLPAAPTASPPGPGGGWLDGSPWPAVSMQEPSARVEVVHSPVDLEVSAVPSFPPTPGVTRLSWIPSSGPNAWTVTTVRVVGAPVEAPPGIYRIALEAPLPGVQGGDFLFPASLGADRYLATLLAMFARLGPGERSSTPFPTSRAFRRPVPAVAWPSALGPGQARILATAHAEVADAEWLYRSTEAPPASAGRSPFVFIPRRVGFYA